MSGGEWAGGYLPASQMMVATGVGTTSLDGLMYDDDPAQGGRPMVGVSFMLGDGTVTPVVALALESAGALIDELTHRVETMGYGVALQHHVEQHRAFLLDGLAELPGEVGVVCGRCGARPDRRTGDGPVAVTHQPGCPVGERL